MGGVGEKSVLEALEARGGVWRRRGASGRLLGVPGGIWREIIFFVIFGKFSFLRFLVILPINFERNSTETFALLAMWNHGMGPKKGGKGVIWGKSRGDKPRPMQRYI